MNSSIFVKNRFAIILLVIILIPTFFAAYFYFSAGNNEDTPNNIASVSVTSPVGTVNRVTAKNDIKIFKNAIMNAEPISEKYRDVENEPAYTVSFTEEDGAVKAYSFFLKNEKDGCIYTDENGDYYLISEDDALKLLEMANFKSVNPDSTLPTVKLGTNEAVLHPTGGSWSFRKADGSFETSTPADYTNSEIVKIKAMSAGSLAFGTQTYPDSVNVVLTQNGVEKYNGSYNNMSGNSSIMSQNDTYYDMTVTAVWDKKDDCDYFGELTYNVKLLYDVSPTYKVIFNGSIIRGDFGIVKIQNFNDGDKLFVTSDYPFPTEIQVFRSPLGYSFAFLPAEYTTAGSSGKHTVTLSLSDGSSQDVSINIKDRRNPATAEQKMLIADPKLSTVVTAAAFEEFNAKAAELTANTNATQLWDGKFVYPNSTNKGTPGTGMADYGTIRNDVGGQFSYIHNGVDLAMNKGDSVYASNNGKVVFAGEMALTGNTVIIDHGCSILSYYGHLDTISVSVGDSVSKSGVIGTAGSTGFAVAENGGGFTEATQVHFAISVEGVFITPYYLWYGGVDFDD